MKVFLDDERATPMGWVRTYTPAETIELIKKGKVTEISLDHDLGDDENIGTGYDVILWIEEQVHTNPEFILPKINVHSANASGVQKMLNGIRSLEKKYHQDRA